MEKIKLFESHNSGFFFSKQYLESVLEKLISWNYLSKINYISEKPYKPSQYPSKFENLDLDLTQQEMNLWAVDFDFEVYPHPKLEQSILEEIEKICHSNDLHFFIERMPSGKYVLTIMQFFPKFVQDFCSKIVGFSETGMSSVYKNVRYFVRMTFTDDQQINLEVNFIGFSLNNSTDISIFAIYLKKELSKKIGYEIELEFISKRRSKEFGNHLIFNLPY